MKKNWYKGITATVIAAAMAGAAFSVPAFAIDYDLNYGDVQVGTNEDGSVWSGQTQDNGETYFHYEKKSDEYEWISGKYQHTNETGEVDNELNVSQGTIEIADAETEPVKENADGKTTSKVSISGDTTAVDVTVDGVKAEVDDGAFITIEKDEKEKDAKADVTIKDTDITLNGNGTSGITVDAGADATLTFNGENKIHSGAATTDGYDNILDKINDSTNTAVNMEGISIGGKAGDDSSATKADVTITTGEEDSSLTIDGVGAGVVVRRDSNLTIDGNGVDDAIEASKALDITISNTLKVNSTISGNGIANYGDLTVTDDADLEIYGNKNSSHGGHIGRSQGSGITNNVNTGNTNTGSFTVSDGASVDIHDVSGYGIYNESYLVDRTENMTVDAASVKINNVGNVGNVGLSGIVADHTNLTFENGAKIDLSNIGYQGIQMGTNNAVKNPYTNRMQDLIIRGRDTVVTIDVAPENGAINLNYGKDLFLYDGASVNVKNGTIAIYSESNVIVENATLDAREVYFYSNWPQSFAPGKIEIRNNAKVILDRVWEYREEDYGKSEIVVIGGTLDLRATEGKGLTKNAYEKLYDKELDGMGLWPTNGSAYGNEKLVNFQLTRDQLHALIHAYGWKDGKAVAYSKDLVDALGENYADWYTVDLSKYGPDEKLSVWVPAVILSYYYQNALPEGKTFENMTDEEWTAFMQNIQQGTDVIIRGESVNFATLGNKPSANLNRNGIDWATGELDGERQNPVPGFDGNTAVIAQNTASIVGLDTVVPDPVPPTPGPDPEPTPGPDPTPDDPTIIVPDNPTPLVPVPDVPEDETIEIPDEETPLAPSAPAEEIIDEVVPLASVPKTGVAGKALPAGVLAAAVAMLLRKKRKNNH